MGSLRTSYLLRLEQVVRIRWWGKDMYYRFNLKYRMEKWATTKCALPVRMDESDLTMEEYIKLMGERTKRRGHSFDWRTATFEGPKSEDIDESLSNAKEILPAIVFENTMEKSNAVSPAQKVCPNFDSNPGTTVEEYVRYEEEKAFKIGKTYDWKTANHIKLIEILMGWTSMPQKFLKQTFQL
ncbi:hypothetical protein Tco_0078932 [Tanacetum coccineum]